MTAGLDSALEMSETEALPEGWTTASLLVVSALIRGVSYKPEQLGDSSDEGVVALLRANNISGAGLTFDNLQHVQNDCVSEIQYLQPGDAVVAMSSGSKSVVGKAASFFGEWRGTFGAFCGVLRPTPEIDSRYFGLYLQTASYRSFISERSAGVNINNLKRQYFDELQIPVPPLAEQRRIAERVEAVLVRVTATRERLDRSTVLLTRFRQSVLAAACSGRLTADWRESNGDETTGAELAEGLRDIHSATGRTFGGKAASPTEGVHDLKVESFPPTWGMVELQLLCALDRPITYGILKPGPDQAPDGVFYVRVADFPGNRLNVHDLKSTTPAIAYEYRRAALKPGDLLLSIRGSVGRVCAVPAELEGANITQDTARISVNELASSRYVLLTLLGPSAQNRLERAMKGVAVRGVNIGDVRALQIPVPGPSEQLEIVRRVDALFALADSIGDRIAATVADVTRLSQGILAMAFRGELVQTEAEIARREGRIYESGEQLLTRIKAERSAAPVSTRARAQSASTGSS